MPINIRMCPPSRYDEAPRGTIVKVLKDNGDFDVYVQVGIDSPVWSLVSNLLELTFRDYTLDEDFVAACLIQNKQERVKKIVDILIGDQK